MAIDQIQRWNQYGKRLLIHGVNMSLGYDFDPRWFACGQSPALRRSRSAGAQRRRGRRVGRQWRILSFIAASGSVQSRYSDLSITDPGNADMAITVGSTHREKPHSMVFLIFLLVGLPAMGE